MANYVDAYELQVKLKVNGSEVKTLEEQLNGEHILDFKIGQEYRKLVDQLNKGFHTTLSIDIDSDSLAKINAIKSGSIGNVPGGATKSLESDESYLDKLIDKAKQLSEIVNGTKNAVVKNSYMKSASQEILKPAKNQNIPNGFADYFEKHKKDISEYTQALVSLEAIEERIMELDSDEKYEPTITAGSSKAMQFLYSAQGEDFSFKPQIPKRAEVVKEVKTVQDEVSNAFNPTIKEFIVTDEAIASIKSQIEEKLKINLNNIAVDGENSEAIGNNIGVSGTEISTAIAEAIKSAFSNITLEVNNATINVKSGTTTTSSVSSANELQSGISTVGTPTGSRGASKLPTVGAHTGARGASTPPAVGKPIIQRGRSRGSRSGVSAVGGKQVDTDTAINKASDLIYKIRKLQSSFQKLGDSDSMDTVDKLVQMIDRLQTGIESASKGNNPIQSVNQLMALISTIEKEIPKIRVDLPHSQSQSELRTQINATATEMLNLYNQIEKRIVAIDNAKGVSEIEKQSLKDKYLYQQKQLGNLLDDKMGGEVDYGDLKEMSDQIEKTRFHLSNLEQEYIVFNDTAKKSSALEKEAKSAATARVQIERLSKSIAQYGQTNSAFMKDDALRARYDEISQKAANLEVDDWEGLKQVQNDFNALQKDVTALGLTGQSTGEKIKNMFKKFGGWSLVTRSLTKIYSLIRKIFSAVREVDTAMVNLKKVSEGTTKEYDAFLTRASESAQRLGTSITGIIEATAEFSRLGYNLEDSTRLGEFATLYSRVAEDLTASDAAQSIVSTMKAFRIEAEDAIKIVDLFNYVGNNFAISSASIGESLQRSASSLAAANTSLQETVALTTAANEIMQDPLKVGTSLKTISARIRGAKTELDEMGESTDDLAGSTAKLQAEIKALSGVDIMVSPTQFKSIYQVFDELSMVWEKLTDVQRASIAEKFGGKNGLNTVYSIITNFQTARNVMDEAEQSTGSAEEELGRAMDSIDGKLAQLSATFQSFATEVIDSSLAKTVLTGLNGIAKALTTILSLVDKMWPFIVGIGASKLITLIRSGKFSGLLAGGAQLGYANAQKELLKVQHAVANGQSLETYFSTSNNPYNSSLKTFFNQNGITESELRKNGISVDMIRQYATSTERLGLAGRVAASGINLLKTAIKGIIIGAAITGIYHLIDNLVNKSKRLKEEAEELARTYQDSTTSIKDNMSKIQSIADEYNKLSRGVDGYGNNISLTNEQYDRYKELCTEIIEINPSLIEGYNDQKGAILKVKDAIAATNDELERQLRNEKILDTSDEKLATYFKNAHNEIEDYQSDINELNNQRDRDINDVYTKITAAAQEMNGILASYLDINPNSSDNPLFESVRKSVDDLLNPNNTDYILDQIRHNGENYKKVIQGIFSDLTTLGEDLEIGRPYSLAFDELMSSKWSYDEIDRQVSALEEKIKDVQKIFSEKAIEILESNSLYDKASDAMKLAMSNLIKNVDYEEIYKSVGKNEVKAINVYRTKINEIISKLNKSGLNDTFESLLNTNGNELYLDYKERINKYISELSNNDIIKELGLSNDDLRLAFGFSIKLNDDSIVDEIDNMYENIMNRIMDKFGNKSYGQDKTIYERISHLTIDQIKAVFNQPLDDFKTIDEFWNWMDNKLLSFDINDYSDEIKSLSETLTELKGSLDSLSSGTLGAKDVLSLLSEFPELEQYVDSTTSDFGKLSEGLIEIAKSKPDELIRKLNAITSSMTGDTSKVDRVIELIRRMQNEILGLDRSGLLEYSKGYIETLISDLEKANKKLEEQKKIVEELTNSYEGAQNAVLKLLDDEISSLQDRQTTVKDYYDSQIELLQKENDEREKNIDLQEKQKALDDAKRNKTRVYSAARGWTIQTDSAAIAKAEADLEAAQSSDTISQLEAQRDKEDEAIQASIDRIEAYRKLWEKATSNNLSSLEDRREAQKLLGDDWAQKIKSGDQSIINAFRLGYEEEVRKLFGINTDIEENNKQIDTLNSTISDIDEILGSKETGLNPIWDAENNTNLTVSTISTTLSDFVTWVKTEAAKIIPPTSEEAKGSDTAELVGKIMSSGLGFLDAYEMAQFIVDSTPISGTVDNPINDVSPIITRPSNQKVFSPTITNYFNANHVDDTLIANWFDNMLQKKYSEFLALG